MGRECWWWEGGAILNRAGRGNLFGKIHLIRGLGGIEKQLYETFMGIFQAKKPAGAKTKAGIHMPCSGMVSRLAWLERAE